MLVRKRIRKIVRDCIEGGLSRCMISSLEVAIRKRSQ